VFAAGAFVVGAVYIIRRLPAEIPPIKRLYMLTGLAAVCVAGLILVSGTVGEDIRRDFTKTRPGQTLVEQSYYSRVWQWRAAYSMWRKHPWFGVGSHGFRYYLPFYTPAPYLPQLTQDHAGNVHNDFLQFLCEQGVVGATLIVAFFALMIQPLTASRQWKREIVIFPAIGALLVLIHSFFDLPFRCPAVLVVWVIVTAASGRYAQLLARAGGE